MIVLEALQYVAESGSIVAIDWALVFIAEMKNFFEDVSWKDQYIILVYFGIAFYNYTRDIRYRYGMIAKEKLRSYKLHDRYFILVEHLVSIPGVGESDRQNLLYLVHAIYASFSTRFLSHDQAQRARAIALSKKVRQAKERKGSGLSVFLVGLHLHQLGELFYLEGYVKQAWTSYSDALKYLQFWVTCNSSVATYFYDVIYSKSKTFV